MNRNCFVFCSVLLLVIPFKSLLSQERNAFLKGQFLASDSVDLARISIQNYLVIQDSFSLGIELFDALSRIKYEPPENFIIGNMETVESYNYGFSLQGGYEVSDISALKVSTGLNKGFTNFRSLWIDTYYKQLFGRFEKYEISNPYSGFVEFRHRYEFLPATGVLTNSISYQYQEIPAIWEISLDQGLSKLNTIRHLGSFHSSLELLVHPRTRIRLQGWVREQTDRSTRVSVHGSVKHALSETLFLKAQYGHTWEGNQFSADWIDLEFNKEVTPSHMIGIYLNGYHDDGEIEEASPTSDLSAPAVDTIEYGIKYQYEGSANLRLTLMLGGFKSDYAESLHALGYANALYADRTWISIGFSAQVFY